MTFGLCLFAACKLDASSPADKVHTVVFYKAPDRDLMITKESVEHLVAQEYGTRYVADGYRLSVVDLGTGKRIKRLVLGRNADDWTFVYIGLAGGRLWFYDRKHGLRLHARRPDTLAVEWDEQEIVRRNPALAPGLVDSSTPTNYFAVDPAGKSLYVTTADGHGFFIDPVTVTAKPAPGRPAWAADARNPSHRTYEREVETNHGLRLRLAGETRQAIEVERDPVNTPEPPQARAIEPDAGNGRELRVDGSATPTTVAQREAPAQAPRTPADASRGPTFLQANFIADGAERDRAAAIESPLGLLFVVHANKLGDGAHPVVSAVDPARRFAVRWSTELPGVDLGFTDHFATAATVGDLLVLAGSAQAVALDMSTGAIRWRYRF